MLGALSRDATLGQGNEDDGEDDGQEQTSEHNQDVGTYLASRHSAERGLHAASKIPESAGHLSYDTGHDQKTDPVSDPVLVDLLTQPHQEHGATGHDHDQRDLPSKANITGVIEELLETCIPPPEPVIK